MPGDRLASYLERIGYDGPVAPDLKTLRGMHRAHWRYVPFENLSIQRGEPIVVEPEQNFEKVVARRRGGFCLELTGLFAWALREIGFEVDILGAQVLGPDGQPGKPLSHMLLLVHLDEPWIADVGFGGNISQPLRLNERGPQTDGTRSYLVENDADAWTVTCLENTLADAIAPRPNQRYIFEVEPYDYSDFVEVCGWLQTSPESLFTRGDLVSIASDDGRTTLARGRLIVTRGEAREESEVAADEVEALLSERFQLQL